MANTHKVEIKNMKFNPDNVNIAAGDSVEWTNSMGMEHTATGDNGEFDSGDIGEGGTYTHQFTAAGTVAYHCTIHPRMKAKVTVA